MKLLLTMRSGPVSSKLSREDAVPDYPCGVCGDQVLEEGMGCEGGCEQWFHLPCINMTDAECKAFSDNENAYWECKSCHPPINLPKYQTCYPSNVEQASFGELRGQNLYYNTVNSKQSILMK